MYNATSTNISTGSDWQETDNYHYISSDTATASY